MKRNRNFFGKKFFTVRKQKSNKTQYCCKECAKNEKLTEIASVCYHLCVETILNFFAKGGCIAYAEKSHMPNLFSAFI